MKHIIFAEDDKDDQLLLSMALEGTGTDVHATFVDDGLVSCTDRGSSLI